MFLALVSGTCGWRKHTDVADRERHRGRIALSDQRGLKRQEAQGPPGDDRPSTKCPRLLTWRARVYMRPIVCVGAPFVALPVTVLPPEETIAPPAAWNPTLLPVIIVSAMRTVDSVPE